MHLFFEKKSNVLGEIVIILFTYCNLNAYSYSYHMFVSIACPVWLDLMLKINQLSRFWYLWQWGTMKAQLSLRKCVDLPEPSLLRYRNICRLRLRSQFSPAMPALAHMS